MTDQRKQVTLYTTPTCPWCMVAKHYLTERTIRFTVVDVSSDRTGLREMVLMTAQHGVPVIRVGEKAMVGWDPEEFERLLAR